MCFAFLFVALYLRIWWRWMLPLLQNIKWNWVFTSLYNSQTHPESESDSNRWNPRNEKDCWEYKAAIKCKLPRRLREGEREINTGEGCNNVISNKLTEKSFDFRLLMTPRRWESSRIRRTSPTFHIMEIFRRKQQWNDNASWRRLLTIEVHFKLKRNWFWKRASWDSYSNTVQVQFPVY